MQPEPPPQRAALSPSLTATSPMQRLLIALSLWFAVLLPAQAYSVVNGQIRDANGQAVELRGINWFGFETETLAAHGLWKRNWKDLIAQIKTLNFNAVRLPICPSTLRGAAVSGVDGGCCSSDQDGIR